MWHHYVPIRGICLRLKMDRGNMKKTTITIALALLLAGCNGAKNTEIPTDIQNLDSIKTAVDKLEPEERELVAGYVLRHTLGAAFGDKTAGIPPGVTIGKAIDEQRDFLAQKKIEEAKQAALKAELEARKEAAMKQMRDAVTVTLVSKAIEVERGYSGIVTDEQFAVSFGYKNNTDKAIAGVKGYVSIKDLFGDEISGFALSNDDTIEPGSSMTWLGSRSVKYAVGNNNDRKLAELDDTKYKVVWEPQVIVFTDGSKLEQPQG